MKRILNIACDEKVILFLSGQCYTSFARADEFLKTQYIINHKTNNMEGTVGEIRLFAATFAPRDWAYCDGSLVAIRSNTALFSILGTYYGGDGKTTFGLPDLRGRSAIGIGTGPGLSPYDLGQSDGASSVTLTNANLPAHVHPINVTINTGAYSDLGGLNVPGTNVLGSIPYGYTANPGDTTMAPFRISVTLAEAGGTSVPLSIQQPYLGMSYIICLYGVFPSRD